MNKLSNFAVIMLYMAVFTVCVTHYATKKAQLSFLNQYECLDLETTDDLTHL